MGLTASRDTVRAGNDAITELVSVLLGANKQVFAGGMVVISADTGYGEAGDNAIGTDRIMGIALRDAGATSGQAAGAVSVDVRRGSFWLNNSLTDPVAQVDVGKVVYIEDDSTIAKTAGSLSAAGVLLGLGTSDDQNHPNEVLVQISGPAMP